LGKTWSGTWCFDGEFVVRCVVDVVFWMVCFWGPKNVTDFEIYFSGRDWKVEDVPLRLECRGKSYPSAKKVSLRRRVIVLRLV
jgi:hypothetical protein